MQIPMVSGKKETVKPVPVRQGTRLLDAKGVPWREIARRLGVCVQLVVVGWDCGGNPGPRKGYTEDRMYSTEQCKLAVTVE